MKYTLVCSAAGSGLSASVKKLHRYQLSTLPPPDAALVETGEIHPPIAIRDVESHLCQHSDVWDLEIFDGIGESRSMAQICRKLPRSDVLPYWRKSLGSALNQLEHAQSDHLLLACHLTLFSTARNELYVPGRPSDFLCEASDGKEHQVARVIVLIDDIYDMYARLTGPHEAISEDQQIENYAVFSKKLTGVDLRDAPELLKLENRFRILQTCLQWRKSELIHAESLARSLGDVPFTVLGVKHSLPSFFDLVVDEKMPAIYLSHKISEARRQNKSNPGHWPAFVDEINQLSNRFRPKGITLIHPTAIDELRTTSSTGSGDRQVGLGDRWPLQEECDRLMYVPTDKYDGPEYTELFSDFSFAEEETLEQAVAHFRAFELSIFNEIAFRDHLLVSSTDGLLLYRPLAENGQDSSGARAEVQHWEQRWNSEQVPHDRKPKLVAMHAFEDIQLRLTELIHSEKMHLKFMWIHALDRQGLDHQQSTALVDGEDPKSYHLFTMTGAEDLENERERAALTALMQCFNSWLCNVHLGSRRIGAAIVARETAEDLVTDEVLLQVASIFNNKDDVTEATYRSLGDYLTFFGFQSYSMFAWSIINSCD